MIIKKCLEQEDLFRKQFIYMANACVELHSKRASNYENITFSHDLSMVKIVDGKPYLTNPYFRIEECLSSL